MKKNNSSYMGHYRGITPRLEDIIVQLGTKTKTKPIKRKRKIK